MTPSACKGRASTSKQVSKKRAVLSLYWESVSGIVRLRLARPRQPSTSFKAGAPTTPSAQSITSRSGHRVGGAAAACEPPPGPHGQCPELRSGRVELGLSGASDQIQGLEPSLPKS